MIASEFGPGLSAPYLALGVLSSAVSYDTGRSVASKSRLRREAIRNATGTSPNLRAGSVIMRFILSSRYATTGNPAAAERDLAAARHEAAVHGDIHWLDMAESFHLCAWKKILWYRAAQVAWPTAQYFGIADDDAFVQLAHLEADLRGVVSASGYVLYGLIMWKAYYNQKTLEPTKLFGGWQYSDQSAASMRHKLDRCAAALRGEPNASALLPPCTKVPPRELVQLRAGSMHQSPPYPFANGPLFVVSRKLGTLLAEHAYPTAWLSELEQTPALLRYHRRKRVSFVLRKDACYPASFDAVLGWWVYRVAAAAGVTPTLVNTQFMVQHHPWVAFRHGAFSNASIILHELKNPRSPGWAFARKAGGGPFERTARVCGRCQADMGWDSVSGSPFGEWECCGSRITRGRVRAGCRKDREPSCCLPLI